MIYVPIIIILCSSIPENTIGNYAIACNKTSVGNGAKRIFRWDKSYRKNFNETQVTKGNNYSILNEVR